MNKKSTRVITAHASDYLHRLCRHFSRNVSASWDNDKGHVAFEIGSCRMEADAEGLNLICQSDTVENLECLLSVIQSHLQRFAQREGLTVTW